jgi:hypothetical protein
MGEWSDAMADGVICEGCGCLGNTATCGCDGSRAILDRRANPSRKDGGATQASIMDAIHDPHGLRKTDR